VCFTAIRDLLNKTGVQPRQIKVVVVNCSLFNPTPSLSATIMNHFKMSSSTINYNLSGMGCSGGGATAAGAGGRAGGRGGVAVVWRGVRGGAGRVGLVGAGAVGSGARGAGSHPAWQPKGGGAEGLARRAPRAAPGSWKPSCAADPPEPPPPAPAASVISIDMARQMLQLYPDTYALVVSTENITQNR
jgi:hypothetical protein